MVKGSEHGLVSSLEDLRDSSRGAHGGTGKEKSGHARRLHRGADESIAQSVGGESLQTSPEAKQAIAYIRWRKMCANYDVAMKIFKPEAVFKALDNPVSQLLAELIPLDGRSHRGRAHSDRPVIASFRGKPGFCAAAYGQLDGGLLWNRAISDELPVLPLMVGGEK